MFKDTDIVDKVKNMFLKGLFKKYLDSKKTAKICPIVIR